MDGTVVAINVCTTSIVTFDNKLHVVPNQIIVKNPLTNYSRMPKRRVDVIVGIPVEQKMGPVREAIIAALYDCTSDGKVLRDPWPKVAVSSIDGVYNYVIITPWITNVSPENFVRLLWHFKETTVRALKQAGIPCAVPNLHVYLHRGDPKASMAPPDAQEQIDELRHRLHRHRSSHRSSSSSSGSGSLLTDASADERAGVRDEAQVSLLDQLTAPAPASDTLEQISFTLPTSTPEEVAAAAAAGAIAGASDDAAAAEEATAATTTTTTTTEKPKHSKKKKTK